MSILFIYFSTFSRIDCHWSEKWIYYLFDTKQLMFVFHLLKRWKQQKLHKFDYLKKRRRKKKKTECGIERPNDRGYDIISFLFFSFRTYVWLAREQCASVCVREYVCVSYLMLFVDFFFLLFLFFVMKFVHSHDVHRMCVRTCVDVCESVRMSVYKSEHTHCVYDNGDCHIVVEMCFLRWNENRK